MQVIHLLRWTDYRKEFICPHHIHFTAHPQSQTHPIHLNTTLNTTNYPQSQPFSLSNFDFHRLNQPQLHILRLILTQILHQPRYFPYPRPILLRQPSSDPPQPILVMRQPFLLLLLDCSHQ